MKRLFTTALAFFLTLSGVGVTEVSARGTDAEIEAAQAEVDRIQGLINEGIIGFYRQNETYDDIIDMINRGNELAYDEFGHNITNISDPADATSIDNVLAALDRIAEGNQLRALDEHRQANPDGAENALAVTDYMMAFAQIEANYTANNFTHWTALKEAGYFSNTGENISAASSAGNNPFDGWYNREKEAYDEYLNDHPDTDADDIYANAPTAFNEKYAAEIEAGTKRKVSSVGHYMNITNPMGESRRAYTIAGLGYSQYTGNGYGYSYAQDFAKSTGTSGNLPWGTAYSVEEYKANVIAYRDNLNTQLAEAQRILEELQSGEEDETIHVTSVELSQSSMTIFAEEGVKSLSAKVYPEDAADKSVTWSSSDPAVAEVSYGSVTGISAGTAVITVTTNDGGFTASCEVTVKARTEKDDQGFTYFLYEDEETGESIYRIMGYSGPETDIYIPSSYKGLPVTMIEDEAFYMNDQIVNVILPESVNEIGWKSFYHCANLESISFTNAVTSIANSSVVDCPKLKDIYYLGTSSEFDAISGNYYRDIVDNIHCLANGSSGIPKINSEEIELRASTADEIKAASFTWYSRNYDTGGEWEPVQPEKQTDTETNSIIRIKRTEDIFSREFKCTAEYWNGYQADSRMTVSDPLVSIPEDKIIGWSNTGVPIIYTDAFNEQYNHVIMFYDRKATMDLPKYDIYKEDLKKAYPEYDPITLYEIFDNSALDPFPADISYPVDAGDDAELIVATVLRKLDSSYEDGKISFTADCCDEYFVLKKNPEASYSTFDITYHLNGGEIAGKEAVKGIVKDTYVNSGTSFTLPYDDAENGISRKGYYLEGWYTDAKFKNGPVYEFSTSDSVNKVFYAKWTPKDYYVTLDANGGEFKNDVSGDYTVNYLHMTYGKKAAVTVKPLRTGYKFAGWADDSDPDTVKYKSGTKYQFSDDGEGIVLHAVWTPVTYTLKLYVNGGSVEGGIVKKGVITEKYTVEETQSVRNLLVSELAVKNGYVFDGWYTDKKFRKETITDEYDFAGSAKNLTVYAKWIAKDYHVTLNANGGTLNNPDASVMDKTVGKKTAIKNPASRTGYKFLGWSSDPNAEKTEYKDTVKYSSFSENGDDVTLYAVWSPVVYMLKLNVKGGTMEGFTAKNGAVTVKYSVDDAEGLADILSDSSIIRKGYNFAGWYTDRKFKNPFDNPAVLISEPKNRTLYAKWEGKQYYITLFANAPDAYFPDLSNAVQNGGIDANHLYSDGPGTSNMILNTYMIYGKKAGIAAKPVRSGYTFLGWAYEPDASKAKFKSGTKYSTFSEDGTNVVLYAVWKKK